MGRGDLFGALQDDLIQHVLSFLPSRDAVQSAVLSRGWRDLWRSTPAVRVRGNDDSFRLFVNSLLFQRDFPSPLREFEIDTDLSIGEEDSDDDEDEDSDDDDYEDYGDESPEIDPHVDQWIRHAVLTCRARSLTARFRDEDTMWSPRQPRPFASRHLTTMHLLGVKLSDGLLDFSCCPALLHLSLTDCRLKGHAFVSPSLERLSIIDCDIGISRNAGGRTRMGISTPSLLYLQLSDHYSNGFPKAPSLESMPLLTNASIQLTGYLACNTAQVYDGDDHSTDGRSLLLYGLSEATSLELMASPSSDGRAILLRDLKWCPTFTKLKTLVLNEWCVYAEVTEFVCLLQHTPMLESLILQLPFKNLPTVEVKPEGSHVSSELTLEHLKTVEIKNCRPSYYSNRMVYFSERVDQIMKMFSDWGIPSNKISINNKQLEGQPSTCTQFLYAVLDE